MYDKRQDEDYEVTGYDFYIHEMLPINTKNAIKLLEKLRMSGINLFFDTIVCLYRCITKIFSCIYHELSF
jgi:hypothetical protein